MHITLVTGNKHKLAQWQRIFPDTIELDAADIDLDEIQSFNPEVIVTDKVKRAYAELGRPVLVEDVTAGLDHLNGLPGPFIKFFEQQLGKEALFILGGRQEVPATVACTIGYYDGTQLLLARGEVHGTVVAARGDVGFGFDFVFKPENEMQTYAEMPVEHKDTISHRRLAIDDMVAKLRSLEQ